MYAFRALTLDIREPASPCDPEGKWYDRRLVADAIARKVERRDGARRRRVAVRDEEMQREGRALANEWAKRRHFETIDAYMQANGLHWIDAYEQVLRSIGGPRAMPRSDRWVGGALGVTAREYAPSADELRAGRVALGLGE